MPVKDRMAEAWKQPLKGIALIEGARRDLELAEHGLAMAFVAEWAHLTTDQRTQRWQDEYRRILALGRPVFWNKRSCHLSVMPADYDGGRLV